jgi:hypothetical protein
MVPTQPAHLNARLSVNQGKGMEKIDQWGYPASRAGSGITGGMRPRGLASVLYSVALV